MEYDELYLLHQCLLEWISNRVLAICDIYHTLLFGWHAVWAEWLLRKECNARFDKALHDANGYHRRWHRHLTKKRAHHRPRTGY